MKEEDLWWYCHDWHPKYNNQPLHIANLSYLLIPSTVYRCLDRVREDHRRLGDALYSVWSGMITNKSEVMHPIKYLVKDVIYHPESTTYEMVGEINFVDIIGFHGNVVKKHLYDISRHDKTYYTYHLDFDYGDYALTGMYQNEFIKSLELTYEACCMSCTSYNDQAFQKAINELYKNISMCRKLVEWLH